MEVGKCRFDFFDAVRRKHRAHVDIVRDQGRTVQRSGKTADDHKLDTRISEPVQQHV
jgi:hypothetical protein